MRYLTEDGKKDYNNNLDKLYTDIGVQLFKDNINYDELLDEWFELVMKESDRVRELSYEEYYKNQYSFKQGRLQGYAEGLIMATSILSNLERKIKKR